VRWRAIVLLVGLGLLAAACGEDDVPPADAHPAATTITTTTAVDEPTGVRLDERTIASLSTVVAMPEGGGPHPLVVFVHGAGVPPIFYDDLLRDLAAAGHVVVAPSMPGSVDHSNFQALAALPWQPWRVQQVIDEVTTGPRSLDAVDPERIVVVGHSLGGMTALALGFNRCCADPRVDGVVAVAGRLATLPGGAWRRGEIPVLLVHGDGDRTVPYRGSTEAMDRVGTSAHLLTVRRADHGEYLGPEHRAYPAVVAALLGFLELTVDGNPDSGLADLAAAGRMPGVRLTTRR
jgi:dienelactone hydrolase